MKYTIKVEYTTGDSFHTEDAEGSVDLIWEDLKVVKVALQRIKEHYEWFQDMNNSYSFRVKKAERPEWHKTNMEDDKFSRQYVINFPLDDGSEQQLSAFWCGYFEHLNAVEIVVAQEEIDSMRITF